MVVERADRGGLKEKGLKIWSIRVGKVWELMELGPRGSRVRCIQLLSSLSFQEVQDFTYATVLPTVRPGPPMSWFYPT